MAVDVGNAIDASQPVSIEMGHNPQRQRWPLSWGMIGPAMRVTDAALVGLGGLVAELLSVDLVANSAGTRELAWLIATALTPYCLSAARAYADPVPRNLPAAVGPALRGLVRLVAALATIGVVMGEAAAFPPVYLEIWLIFSGGAILAARVALTGVVHSRRYGMQFEQTVAIVGAGEWGERLAGHLAEHSAGRYRSVGIFDDRLARHPAVVGNLNDLIQIGRQRRIDLVIIALPWSAEQRLDKIFEKLKALPATIALCPEGIGFGLLNRPILHVAKLPLLTVADQPIAGWGFVAKALEDRIFGTLALLLAAPVMALIALAIKLESPGPIFFGQLRDGFNGGTIRVLKFRTMRTDAADHSGVLQTQRDDPRITRIGRFLRSTSLDELPQLMNVLRGEMSLVGPRPHPRTMRTEDKLSQDIISEYAHRHRVKPGMTGWAQVNGLRGATHSSNQLVSRVKHDLYYIENWSLGLDMKILFLTVFRGFVGKNAY